MWHWNGNKRWHQKNTTPLSMRITASSPNYEKHSSESSLSFPILNAMANYKRQYSILYQLKSSDLAKYVRRGVDVNYGYTSWIYPNHNPVYESLMVGSITVTNIEHYHLRLIIHMRKQINNILWYCDSKIKQKEKIEAVWEYTSLFWWKSWFYLLESWRTSIWIITILPNPYMSHAHNKHLVVNLCICIEHAALKIILTLLMHLSESCVRKNSIMFQKLQAAARRQTTCW